MQGDQEQNIYTPSPYTAEPLTDTGAHPTQADLIPLLNFRESGETLKHLARQAKSTSCTTCWCSTKSLWK